MTSLGVTGSLETGENEEKKLSPFVKTSTNGHFLVLPPSSSLQLRALEKPCGTFVS